MSCKRPSIGSDLGILPEEIKGGTDKGNGSGRDMAGLCDGKCECIGWVENVGIFVVGVGREGDCDGCSESDGGLIGLLLFSLIGGEAVPSSLCGLEPPPPLVVIIPLVLEGGRACSFNLVGITESPGD